MTSKTSIFISYSRRDNPFVDRLRTDLRHAGLNIWIDKTGLPPGTRNWERAIRKALDESYAVLWVVSPASYESDYVQDEISIAELHNVPIYPIWAGGDDWMKCVPLGMGKVQHVDARGEAYKVALPLIIKAVQGEAEGLEVPTLALPERDSGFVPRNPYKGLQAFSETDAGDFFGRDSLVENLRGTLEEHIHDEKARFLAVIGASGSGKSSVVMAGLIPRLKMGALPDSDKWIYLPRIVPGTQPIESLKNAIATLLPRKTPEAIQDRLNAPSADGLNTLALEMAVQQGGRRVLLFVDQFEELFTLTEREEERQQFINLLTQAVTEPDGPLILVITLRADFYDRPMNYRELGPLLEAHHKSVLPMSLTDLREAIEMPAALPEVRLGFEAGLVAEIIFELRDQSDALSGALPLLQFTLDQLYKLDGEEGKLTLESYRSIGGVRGALAKRADETLREMTTEEQDLARDVLFMRLVEPGETEQDTVRRRASLSRLALSDPDKTALLHGVAEKFIQARLLVTDKVGSETTIEVAHEALIREWGQLKKWLQDKREDIRFQKFLAIDAAEWERRGQRTDDLYRGTRLIDAQNWASKNTSTFSERQFIVASVSWEAELQAREEQRKQELLAAAEEAKRAQRLAEEAEQRAVRTARAAEDAEQKAAQTAKIAEAAEQRAAQTAQVAEQAEQKAAKTEQNARTVRRFASVAVVVLLIAAFVAAIISFTATNQVSQAQAEVNRVSVFVATAQTQVAVVGSTLTPAEMTVQAGNAQIATARIEQADARDRADVAATSAALALANASTATIAQGQAIEQVASAKTQVAESGLTLTPVALTLAAGDSQLAEARQQIITANDLADRASTQVSEAGLTLTPVPQTLTPIGATLAAANNQIGTAQSQVEGVQPTLDSASTQVAGVQPTLDTAGTLVAAVVPTVSGAQTQVAEAGLLLTPIPLTLTPVGATLAAANELAAGAQTQVAVSGLTLTPVPQTLTPVALTLAAGDAQLAEARQQIITANDLADSAGTQVAEAGLTLTPVPQTLTPVGATLAAANELAAGAQTQVAVSGLTLTPVPQTLTPVALTLAAGNDQLATAQGQLVDANALADSAGTQVAESGLTLTPVPLTLTPVGATLAAANELLGTSQARVDGVQPTLDSAGTQIAGVQPTLDSAGTQVAGVQPTIAGAQTQVAAVLPTLTAVVSEIQVRSDLADSLRLSVAGQQVLGVGNPDLAMALMLEAYRLNPALVETQRVLNAAIPQTVRLNLGNATDPVNLFSPDGRYFVSSDGGSAIVIWEVATRRQVQLLASGGEVSVLMFTPDGRYLINGTRNGVVHVWDMESGQERATINTGRGRITSIDYSSGGPAGEVVIAGSEDYSATIYNLSEMKQVARLDQHEAPVSFVWFNANGTKAFSVDYGRQTVQRKYFPRVTIYDLVTNTDFIQTPDSYRGLSPNGDYAYTGGDGSGFITLWKPETFQKLRTFNLGSAKDDYINQFAFSQDNLNLLVHVETRAYAPNSTYVVTGRQLELWDIKTGGLIRTFDVNEDNPRNWEVYSLALSADGHLALTGGRYGSIYTVTLWDVDTGEELRRFTGHTAPITNVGFSTDGRTAYSYAQGNSRVWDIETDINEARKFKFDLNDFTDYGLSADGTRLYLAYNQQSMTTLDLANAREVPDRRYLTAEQSHVAFSPTEPLALVDTTDGLALWDMNTSDRLFRFIDDVGDIGKVTALRFSMDGRYAVIGTTRQVILWDVGNRMVERTWNYSGADYVAVSPDNQYLIAASQDSGSIQLFDVVTGQTVRDYSGYNGKLNAIAYSPIGDTIIAAVGEPDNAVFLWDVPTGNLIYTMVGHNDNVNVVAYSPDGKTALSGSDDQTLILWDVQTGQSVTVLRGHTASITDIVFSPDGKRAYSASANQDDGILVWPLQSVQDTVAWVLANRYVIELSCSQRSQYGVRPACINDVAPSLTPSFTPPATYTPTATSTLRPTFTPTATAIPTGRVIAETDVNVRSGAGSGFRVVGKVAPGTIVEIYEVQQDTGWLFIRVPSQSLEGWIRIEVVDR